jgi:hypothetical protein
MQLGVMSNMLRGLPMQSSTTNQYVAAPNQITQGIGLAGAGASIMNAMKKEGGVIKEMASGGITGYNVGGGIRSKLYDMDANDIQAYIKESASPAAKEIAEEVLRDKTGKAGGGIIAFADSTAENNQSVVKEDPEMVRQAYIDAARAQAAELPPVEKPVAPAPNTGIGRGRGSVPPPSPRSIVAAAPETPVVAPDVRVGRGATKPEVSPRVAAARAFEARQNAAPVEAAPAVVPEAKPAAPAGVPSAAIPLAPAPVPAGVPPKIVPPTAPAAAPAVNPAGIKLPPGFEPPANPDANKSIADLIAEKEAYMGPNAGNQDARAKLMAERANAKDESRRTMSLRMAEFFGAWGSTPGNSIVAGLNALKNKIPDFITDIKEESKVRREIDKSITELDKIDRLEKSGNWDEASKRKNDLGKRDFDTWGKKIEYLYHHEANVSREKAAAISALNRGTGKADDSYFKALANEGKVNKEIAEAKKGSDYQRNAVIAQSGSGKAKEEAAAWIKSKETEFQEKIATAKNITKQFDKMGRMEHGADSAEEPKNNAPTGVKPTTQQEYSKLPKGAHYVDPNGVTRVKG